MRTLRSSDPIPVLITVHNLNPNPNPPHAKSTPTQLDTTRFNPNQSNATPAQHSSTELKQPTSKPTPCSRTPAQSNPYIFLNRNQTRPTPTLTTDATLPLNVVSFAS